DGFVVPDLPLEESGPLREVARSRKLDLALLASPASDDARIAALSKATRGFLYLVSTYGVTGARDAIDPRAPALVARAKKAAGSTPVCVGFGVSTAEHVRALSEAGADGVIVGSALVARIERGESAAQIASWAAKLRG
ncbi:MAG TPA: tryptophan synthase subunit alpha, partial [Burkholderiales bacterium]|nr:tryptophan synthase subunit alpha [Burkholderiales bacterium]